MKTFEREKTWANFFGKVNILVESLSWIFLRCYMDYRSLIHKMIIGIFFYLQIFFFTMFEQKFAVTILCQSHPWHTLTLFSLMEFFKIGFRKTSFIFLKFLNFLHKTFIKKIILNIFSKLFVNLQLKYFTNYSTSHLIYSINTLRKID